MKKFKFLRSLADYSFDMSYKKLFLFLFLFGFFSLEIDYKAEDFSSKKISKNSISFSWSQAFSMPDDKELPPLDEPTGTLSASTPKDGGSSSGGSASIPGDGGTNCDDDMSSTEIEGKISDWASDKNVLDRKSTTQTLSKDENDEYKKIEKKIRRCGKILERKEKEEQEEKEKQAQCKEEYDKIKEAGFGKACAEFSRGMDCEEAITACTMCPNSASFNFYNCVQVHKQSKCPLLAGNELKQAKEKRDKFQEEVEELEEDISELEKDIVEKQNELNKSLAELEENFTEAVAEFKRDTENAKEDLTADLNENKTAIKNEVSKQIAQVQEALDESLKVAHSFENAITEAHMKYRSETKKVYAECRVQAQAQLARYRSQRKRAIESGAYRVSLSTLTSKNRVTFAQKDTLRLKRYYHECLVLRKSDLKDLKLIFQQRKRVIAQQSEQYQKRLEGLKQKVATLNKMAYEQQNTLLQEYAKKMTKITSQFSEQYSLALQAYEKNKKTLMAETSKINVLEKHLVEKKQSLALKKKELVTEQQLIAYLKSKGVSEENDDGNEEYSAAAGALEDYNNAVTSANTSCGCSSDDEDDWKSDKCENIENRLERLEGGSLGAVIQKVNPSFGTR